MRGQPGKFFLRKTAAHLMLLPIRTSRRVLLHQQRNQLLMRARHIRAGNIQPFIKNTRGAAQLGRQPNALLTPALQPLLNFIALHACENVQNLTIRQSKKGKCLILAKIILDLLANFSHFESMEQLKTNIIPGQMATQLVYLPFTAEEHAALMDMHAAANPGASPEMLARTFADFIGRLILLRDRRNRPAA